MEENIKEELEEKPKKSARTKKKEPKKNLDGLAFFDLGVLKYLEKEDISEVPAEFKQGGMKLRIEEAERKLKDKKLIKG